MNEMEIMRFDKILVIQLRQMGDILLCTPALKALRTKFPGAQIAFLVDSSFEPLLKYNPDLNLVLTRNPTELLEPFRTINRIRQFAPDLVIDYLANPRTALLTLFSGAMTTLSYANKRRAFLYKIKAPSSGGYVAEEKLSLLKPLGVESKDLDLVFNYPASAGAKARERLASLGITERDFLVALDLFHKRPARQWPVPNFIELADRLAEKFDAKVLIICLPQNRHLAEQAMAQARRKHQLASDLDLFELAALIGHARLFLGNDAGTKHIAVSQKTPSFTLPGPSGPQWTPDSPLHQTMAVELDCRPCSFHQCPDPEHPCQNRLSPEAVFQKLSRFIEQTIRKPPA